MDILDSGGFSSPKIALHRLGLFQIDSAGSASQLDHEFTSFITEVNISSLDAVVNTQVGWIRGNPVN